MVGNAADNDDRRVRIADLILRLRRAGVTDQRVVAAIESVPREMFVPAESQAAAYAERALPIDCGQTISAPVIVGMMTAALDVHDRDRVLEVGTGTGYQTAVLAKLARRVYTIDRFRTLVAAAESRFRTLRLANVTTLVGDGMHGWPEQAPFDRIIVTAAGEEVPDALLKQVRIGGVIVAPSARPTASRNSCEWSAPRKALTRKCSPTSASCRSSPARRRGYERDQVTAGQQDFRTESPPLKRLSTLPLLTRASPELCGVSRAMRSVESAFRSRALGQVALVILLAGATAACSGSKRLSEPFITGSTENQRQIIGQNASQPMPAPVASNAVARADLPPPVDYSPSYAATDASAIPQSAYAPPPAPIAEAPRLAVAGGTYVVQQGDTLFGIARRNGTTVGSLVSLNGLASPESIRIGQTLRVEGSGAMQPQQTAALGAPEQPLGQLRVSSDGTATAVATGQPSASAAPAPAAPVALNAPKPPAMPSIPAETQVSPTVNQETATASIDDAVDEASSDGKSFRWPVRGRIISGFGTKPNGEKNDGINLAVPEGTSVKAAEGGTVIYAGNELEGYGNLVLVRHADGWVSAYAHNKEILVKRGDQVRRGQTVGYAGMTGSVTSPQVHFELRKGAKPVNPLDYLAGT
jgi:protein-L-isoaspartate(D-aspartate) O-methyltransferase